MRCRQPRRGSSSTCRGLEGHWSERKTLGRSILVNSDQWHHHRGRRYAGLFLFIFLLICSFGDLLQISAFFTYYVRCVNLFKVVFLVNGRKLIKDVSNKFHYCLFLYKNSKYCTSFTVKFVKKQNCFIFRDWKLISGELRSCTSATRLSATDRFFCFYFYIYHSYHFFTLVVNIYEKSLTNVLMNSI